MPATLKAAGPPRSKGCTSVGDAVGVTPMASSASISGVRPLSGISSICFVVMAWPIEALSVFKQRNVGGYRYGSRDIAHLEPEIDHRALVCAQRQIGAFGFLESLRLRGDLVFARRKEWHGVFSRRVGDGWRFDAGPGFGGDYFGAGDRRAGRVGHRSTDRAAKFLGE